jgi:hypothetical protein
MVLKKFADLTVRNYCTEIKYAIMARALGSCERIAKFFSGKYSRSIKMKGPKLIGVMGDHTDDDMEIDLGSLLNDLLFIADRKLYNKNKKPLTMGELMYAAEGFKMGYPDCKLFDEIENFEDSYYEEDRDDAYGSDDGVMELGKMIQSYGSLPIAKKKRDTTKKGKKSNRKN